ncbi:hypothetical protein [Xanthomonas sacchari]|uniref:hypothetical protein n=1 Tax=Xanthomonas sacchari TaxID=56458 RepID=UPI0020C278D3|nr:hypothetical protein [Xanthomonas sacchari]
MRKNFMHLESYSLHGSTTCGGHALDCVSARSFNRLKFQGVVNGASQANNSSKGNGFVGGLNQPLGASSNSMPSKALVVVLALVCALLGHRVLRLESEVHELQRNAAIALLSAEIANKKVGAFAPYFAEDKEAFANAWLDGANMPSPVFPEDVLVPLQRELARRRAEPVSQKLKAETFH